MTYEQFKTELLKHLKPMFPSSTIEINEVPKSNDTSYEAVTIHTDSQKFSPCIRLQSYYDDFINTERYGSFMDIVNTMIDNIQSLMVSGITSNWANLTQLNFLLNSTCIFIGLSMADPNLRRLLDIASKKSKVNTDCCKHYVILERHFI